MSYSAGVDLDWCLTCNRHLNNSRTSYCSPQCEPTPSPQLLKLSPYAAEWTHSEELDASEEDPVIIHTVHDTSSAKGIAAWAANVPAGAPPNDLDTMPLYSPSQPKLLRPQFSRPVPPALSISESTSASIPLVTPPQKDVSMFFSIANHIRSLVSSSAGFSPNKTRCRTKNRLPNLIARRHSSLSSDSFVEHDNESGPSLSPTNSFYEDKEGLWWVTESDCSSAASSMVPKKSAAQLIAPSESRKHALDCEMYFQPKSLHIPIELSTKVQAARVEDEEGPREMLDIW
ncbi:hypothetical protein J3R30DRAFT_3707740 [Lentinula aciculospora]|uniref:Uncharacterized protein n=1 Tax=Lentinula aciculospora TaxID=153920 RepID=A0A9W9A4Z4_9AGAR|nr:hypothetical protein J3R30DRAFT_3707740 [Lentinula aciculospora]